MKNAIPHYNLFIESKYRIVTSGRNLIRIRDLDLYH